MVGSQRGPRVWLPVAGALQLGHVQTAGGQALCGRPMVRPKGSCFWFPTFVGIAAERILLLFDDNPPAAFLFD